MVPPTYLVFAVMLLSSTMTVEAGKSSEDEVKSCISLANPEAAMCCSVIEDVGKEKKEKCNVKDGDMTCETAKCMLKEDGLDGDDIDMQKAREQMNEFVKKYEGMKDVGDRIEKHCFEDRRFELYPPEDCSAASLILCTYMNSIITCSELPEWKDTDQCKKFAEEAKICKNAMDSM